MGVEENKALVRRWYESWNKGDRNALFALHSDDVKDHNPFSNQAPGLEGVKASLEMFLNAFPGVQLSLDILVAEGDLVADRSTATGTHKGELMGIPATGKTIKVTSSNIWRIKNGKITELWHIEDLAGMMIQLGVAKAPGT